MSGSLHRTVDQGVDFGTPEILAVLDPGGLVGWRVIADLARGVG